MVTHFMLFAMELCYGSGCKIAHIVTGLLLPSRIEAPVQYEAEELAEGKY